MRRCHLKKNVSDGRTYFRTYNEQFPITTLSTSLMCVLSSLSVKSSYWTEMKFRLAKMSLLRQALKVLFLASLCSGQCHDIDPQACENMAQQNPHLCDDPALASAACPKFCGQCALVCYHCDISVRNYMDCNTTRTCQIGEQCVLHELMSSRDGHHEYRMSCASLDMCDGRVLFGRRDVWSRDLRTHCCKDDLCNYPTTTTTTTTATYTGCSRDIEILIQLSSVSAASIIQFLKDLISRIDIGPNGNLVGLVILDGGTHREFQLNSHRSKAELLAALDKIKIRYHSGGIDINDIKHFLNNEFQRVHNGNRLGYEKSIVIIAQDEGSLQSHHSNDDLKVSLSSVTVINIGAGSVNQLSTLATDPQHVIDVADYTSLSNHLTRVLNLLCT